MKFLSFIICCVCLGFVGCKTKPKEVAPTAKKPARVAPAAEEKMKPIVTPAPANTGSGTVSMVNRSARFVIVTFPFGEVPPIDQKLSVYRNGLKVADLKVSGPRRDDNAVADIIAGETQINDEVRYN